MYLGMDGTGVPMRAQQVADRIGKQADKSVNEPKISINPNEREFYARLRIQMPCVRKDIFKDPNHC